MRINANQGAVKRSDELEERSDNRGKKSGDGLLNSGKIAFEEDHFAIALRPRKKHPGLGIRLA
jgi:hypothetical protein